MSQEYIILLAIAVLGYVGHNMSVAYAAGAVLVLRLLGLNVFLENLGKQGLNWGIILLTMAILVPIATGKITWHHIMDTFKSPVGIVAMIVGVGVALAGHKGVGFMLASPEIVSSLIVGTMIGVFFFDGVPVGPLIAAGITYWIVSVLHL